MTINRNPPRMNSRKSPTLEQDLADSKAMIMKWLPKVTKQIQSDLGDEKVGIISHVNWNSDLHDVLYYQPEIIPILRALCIRHIGRLQFSDFAGLKSDSKLKRMENDGATVNFSPLECVNMADVLMNELNPDWASWIFQGRKPTEDEIWLAKQIAGLRLADRELGTRVRYEHEPRQLSKLTLYLESLGYNHVDPRGISDPRKMTPGTYTTGCMLESMQENRELLNNPVDILIMPFTNSTTILPIFMEAKSMTDKANPNKRQKEEGKKIQNLARRWQRSHDDPFVYVLLVGGTIPPRYLETEENQGIDWIFEDRPEDLELLFDWYKNAR